MQSRSHAFTLIETIIATAILAVAVVAIASLFVSSVRTQTINRRRSAAAMLLSDKIEQLKANPVSGFGSDELAEFKRVWRIEGEPAKTITVIVYDTANNELIRSSTLVSPTW